MWIRFIIVLFPFLFFSCELALSQESPVKKDSTQLYKDIEAYSKKRGITKFIHRLIFKPALTPPTKKMAKKRGYNKLIKKPYSAFEGKIIRHIYIKTLDPFGYSITDTNRVPAHFLVKTGNSMHVKSQQPTIKNLLLIRENQRFDSLLVKESERLLRTRSYIHDVSFFATITTKNADSVDIYIRELDNWSLVPKIAYSGSGFSMNLTDKNFLGFGHISDNSFSWNKVPETFAYNINYITPNIRNSYINSTVHLSNDRYKNSARSFVVDRRFFSPFAKWAAGISLGQFRKDSVNSNSLTESQRYKFNAQDYWAGNAIRIFKGNSEYRRTTNFVSTFRFLRIRYIDRPSEMQDTLHMFRNENFYLAGMGISTRTYVQDRYIFKYGLIEDVPVGKVYSITGGYQVLNNIRRYYLGLRYSAGNYHEWGYLSSNIQYGTFFSNARPEQGVFMAEINYFTGLMDIGKWKLRQFIKPQLTIGFNRFFTDSLAINEGYIMDGFKNSNISGTSRLLISLQTQAYAPWNLIGFQFGPFLNLSVGMLGNETTGFKNSKVYTQIGLGVLIKNENLIIRSFQLSLEFYPFIPGKGRDIFKMNSFKTTDFGFRDFEIGKPDPVPFQ